VAFALHTTGLEEAAMDERKPNTSDELTLDDPLGIAHTDVAGDHIQGLSEEEAATRRRRARAGLDGHDDHQRPGMGDVNVDPDGAAGIDMGYGGEGTDIKP
jgi:hypothetical protein